MPVIMEASDLLTHSIVVIANSSLFRPEVAGAAFNILICKYRHYDEYDFSLDLFFCAFFLYIY